MNFSLKPFKVTLGVAAITENLSVTLAKDSKKYKPQSFAINLSTF